jgi:hypothetical protein
VDSGQVGAHRVGRAVDEPQQVADVEVAEALGLVDDDSARAQRVEQQPLELETQVAAVRAMWKSRSPGVLGRDAPRPRWAGRWSSAGIGRPVSAGQTRAPMPTVHARAASRSRMPTVLSSPERSARTERAVAIATASSLTVTTRKTADVVSGASTL